MTDNPPQPHPSPSTALASQNPSNETISSEDDATLPPLPQLSPGDGEKDARNKKRKRTSPEDHDILEQEYMRNPKPDKAARVEIVQKVKLSEKEVQIWFQNKRQSARRKSRPLLPHEIASLGLGSTATLSSDPISSSASDSSQQMYPGEEQLRSDVSAPEALETNPEKEPSLAHEEQSSIKLEAASCAADIEQPISGPPQSIGNISGPDDCVKIEEQESNVEDEASRSQARLPSTEAPIISTPLSTPQMDLPVPCSERETPMDDNPPSSSRMRLSLSLEGRAELQKVSPSRASAPRPSSFNLGPGPRRPHGLQRSKSALPLGLGSMKPLAHSRAPRLTAGRSRDARAWEFYADSGARNEFGVPTEQHDPSGSAVAAISLIRSASNNALKVNHTKRNATPVRAGNSKAVKKPKLSRASSSLARLQGSQKSDSIKPSNDKQSSRFAESPTGDSDKENWISGENCSEAQNFTANTAAPMPKLARQRVLEEQGIMPNFPARGGRRNRKKRSGEKEPSIFEDEVEEKNVDPEVEKFMSGEISPSKRGDLDCVQGLLSLSQGNWR